MGHKLMPPLPSLLMTSVLRNIWDRRKGFVIGGRLKRRVILSRRLNQTENKKAENP